MRDWLYAERSCKKCFLPGALSSRFCYADYTDPLNAILLLCMVLPLKVIQKVKQLQNTAAYLVTTA